MHLPAYGLRKGDEHPAYMYTPHTVTSSPSSFISSQNKLNIYKILKMTIEPDNKALVGGVA